MADRDGDTYKWSFLKEWSNSDLLPHLYLKKILATITLTTLVILNSFIKNWDILNIRVNSTEEEAIGFMLQVWSNVANQS